MTQPWSMWLLPDARDNVKYKSSLSNLTADRVFINLINKNTKIQMNDSNNNILVRSVINNGNN